MWQPHLARNLTRQDRIVFFSATLAALMLSVWLFAAVSAHGLSLFALVCSVGLSLYGLLNAFFGAGQPEHAGIRDLWLPALIATLGMLIVQSIDLNTEQALTCMIISVLLLLSIWPFGALPATLFSIPLLIGNLSILSSSFEASMGPSLAVFGGYVLYWLRLYTAKPREIFRDERVSRDIAELADKLERERYHSQSLAGQLQRKEQAFEQEIAEQTKHLREANTQLSQQIGLRKTISDALVKSQTRLTQAIDASHLGLIDWDIAAGQFYQSAFHEHFGEKEQSSEEVIECLKRVIHEDDYDFVRDTLNACLKGDQSAYELQYRVRDESSWCWIEECGKVIETGVDGRALRILGTRRNIQAQVQRDEQVRLAKSVFDHTSEGVFVLDRQGVFLTANPAYLRTMDCKQSHIIGQNIASLTDTPSREQLYRNVLQEAEQEGSWRGEILEKKIHGDYFPQWTQINAIRDEHGQLEYFSGMVSDISDRKAADEKLDYLLNYDDLTGLANRVQFQNQLHRALMRYRDEDKPFVLVMLDIDRFKQFNDSFGHSASDELLKQIGERLSKSVQQVDILARIGGNEFACIVERSDTFDVQAFASRLFKAVTAAPYELAGHELMISSSIGLARVPEDTQDMASLMRYGALAVQKAKYDGGNQIQRFDASLRSFSRRRLEMEQALRKALGNGELEVFYQPKLDLKTGRITSFEALTRWDHPTLGVISPEEFVNIAEENGLITDLGAFVLETACKQTHIWSQQGFGQLHVSVNLSARQLKDKQLLGLIEHTLSSTGIAPELLELELTESVIMEDAQSAIALLQNIRQKGLKISIDDFGTGYSSLSYLRSLPVDTLKIDRAFVEGVESSQSQLAIVKAIVVLGESLDLQIVAEGVENDQQLELLKSLGCDLIQGYLVSKPLSAKEMEGLLNEQLNEV